MPSRLKFAVFFGLLGACAHAGPSDQRAWPMPAEQTVHAGSTKRSLYVTMRDGEKIAITVTLPGDLQPGEKIPTILRQTRYWREWNFRFPFSLFLGDQHTNDTRRRFIEAGYAWVDADVRGAGASTGHQTCSWCPDEVRDGAQVVDWIITQPWSNGKVGATGVSYDGTAAEMLLLNHHPAVKAIAPRFALFDVYTDVAFPGGVHLTWFTKAWGDFNRAQDRNDVPAALGFAAPLAVKGVMPVDTDDDRRVLAAARQMHLRNHDVHAEALALTYRDDRAPSDHFYGAGVTLLAAPPTHLSGTIGVFSPHTYAEVIASSGVPIFSYSGWWDADYPHAAIKRFSTINTPGSRLIIGPWDHGGAQHIEPFAGTTASTFDHDGELIAFFDRYLRDDAPAPAAARVSYYTMGEGKWKTAESWPPPAAPVTFYASAQHTLAAEVPGEGADEYTVDPEAATGRGARWDALLNVLGKPIGYPDRRDEDARLLTYTSAPLAHDIEVTGHPLVTLRVASTATDGFFFAYLEDVAPDGEVALITEGDLRAQHRRLSAGPAPYQSPAPYRSYEKADAEALMPGQPADLTFDLIPTSYLYRKGHRVRLALAGADRDHFAIYPGDPATWTVLYGATKITLPVVTPR